MIACSFAVALPLGLTARHFSGGARTLQRLVGAASIAVGTLIFAGYIRSILT